MFRNIYAAFLIMSFLANVSMAEERSDVDPSDLTRTVTQLAPRLDSDSNIGFTGSFSGAFESGSQYMAVADVEFGEGDHDNADNEFGTDYISSRTQYFQAFDTDITVAPKVGFSVDYMHFDGDTELLAVGGLFMINPRWTNGLLIFPNLAYAKGTVKDLGSGNAGADVDPRGEIFYSVDEFNLQGLGDFDVDGYMFNLFVSKKINDEGAFVMVWPEYIDVSGDGLEVKQLTWKANLGVPMNSARTWWVNTIFEYKQPDIEVHGNDADLDDKTKISFGVKRYF